MTVDPIGSGRAILSVVAPHSCSGKTAFVAHLARHIRGLGCVKITPAHDPPQAAELEEIPDVDGFYLADAGEIGEPGRNTAQYVSAGAGHVEWLRHRGSGLRAGLEAALERFPAKMPVAVESSAAVKLMALVAVVLVVRPPIREMKPGTQNILHLVTDVLANAPNRAAGTGEIERLTTMFPSLRPAHTWSADLIREPPPTEMLQRLRKLLQRESPAP
jgi:hypothetical protein